MTDVLSPQVSRHHHHVHLPSSPPPTRPSSMVNSKYPSPGPVAAVQKCIPEEPHNLPTASVNPPAVNGKDATDRQVDNLIKKMKSPVLGIDFTRSAKPRRPSFTLVSHDLLSDSSATNLANGGCCGGGCCRLPENQVGRSVSLAARPTIATPDNRAFRSLNLNLAPLTSRARLTGTTALPPQTISLVPVEAAKSVGATTSNGAINTNGTINNNVEMATHQSTVYTHPPEFVSPHPPYSVFSAKIDGARELTKPGAEKRTYHFDLDVTDYPEEAAGVDFRVGGAIGICAPNNFDTVDEIFDILGVPAAERDAPVTLHTQGGRWPTIWGQEQERFLLTTRRELLTWTVDIQSYAPTKNVLRLMAEYAADENEKTILLYLCSKQGQAAFCELRTGPYVSLLQLLNAFPSSKPSFEHLLCNLKTLMPRFYSLSNDPHESRFAHRRIIEIAVSVHECPENWRDGNRTGVGSGFFERCARRMLDGGETEVRVPMFRGLMSNPLAKEFVSDGPMLLIGAGVGIAPFRGFVQRRLQSANCANKVWVLQGVRDSLLDELYSGEWGAHEDKIRKVVESRVGTGRYVQEEVLAQADLVWSIVNALNGRVFVCGSSKGMGEGVEAALVKVAMDKGRTSEEGAKEFWAKKKEGGQYIAETW